MQDGTSGTPVGPELFFGLVGAVGASLSVVEQALTASLADVGYQVSPIRLSDLLHDFHRWKPLAELSAEDDRIERHMRAGREIRKLFGRGDSLALLAVAKLQKDIRQGVLKLGPKEPAGRRAYVFRSLKHPDEVSLLRKLYGPRFLLLGAYSPKRLRVKRLASLIADSRGSLRPADYEPRAQQLVQIDEEEIGESYGQKVRSVFPESDVFVNAADPQGLRNSVQRFVELLFGYPYHTPSRDEYGMFHAYATALRSASMARQVGAVITGEYGEVVAAGCNEVPRAGGGLYWPGDAEDARDFRNEKDLSDELRLKNLGQVIQMLADGGWLSPEMAAQDPRTRLASAKALLKKSQTMSAIEFVRAVHGEMAAIISAARRGTGVAGCTLYTTTFPCHDCAKHIVGVGISKVVYVEPYPKSLAEEMHPDSIVVDDHNPPSNRVVFQPFVGVAPRLYPQMFSAGERKTDEGAVIEWSKDRNRALPRVIDFDAETPLYFIRETKQVGHLDELVQKHSTTLSSPETEKA